MGKSTWLMGALFIGFTGHAGGMECGPILTPATIQELDQRIERGRSNLREHKKTLTREMERQSHTHPPMTNSNSNTRA